MNKQRWTGLALVFLAGEMTVSNTPGALICVLLAAFGTMLVIYD